MSEGRILALGAVLGAIAGSAAAYFWFTEPGRRTWAALEQHAEQAFKHLAETQRVALRLANQVEEGMRDWRAFQDMRHDVPGAA